MLNPHRVENNQTVIFKYRMTQITELMHICYLKFHSDPYQKSYEKTIKRQMPKGNKMKNKWQWCEDNVNVTFK